MTGTGVLAGEQRMLIDGDLTGAAGGVTFDANAGRWRDDVEFRARCVTQLRDGLVRAQERLRRILVTESVPALLAGNAVILKPAQLTPWAGLELGRIAAEETDIPPGIFQVVVSNDNDVAAMLTADPRVDMVTFTGSTAVGRKILAATAPTVKKTIMELGGKSTHIVLDDADLATVLPPAAGGVCTMSGQGCTNATRILLPRRRLAEGLAILKATIERFPYGDPWDMGNYSGPSISDVQRAKVLGLIEGAVAAGATLLAGGGKPAHLPTGYYIEPTLLSDVDPRSVIGQEETFGPVVTVTPYDTEDEAVAIANGTVYGLAGQVSSGDDEHALAVALRIRTGTVGANVASTFSLTSPLGGVGQSGLGRRYGEHGFEEYLEVKAIGLPAGG